MADNLHLTTEHESPTNWPEFARLTAKDWATQSLRVPADTQFYTVWFCFILGGWKSLVSSTAPDGRYYEVTYAKDKGVCFVDTYMKTHNVEIAIV